MSAVSTRNEYISQIESIVRDHSGVSALLSLGDGPTDPTAINLAVVTTGDDMVPKVFPRLNYRITELFAPESTNTLRRSEHLVVKEYLIPGGFSLSVLICAPANLISTPWWRPIFDNDGNAAAAMAASEKVDEDILAADAAPEPEPYAEPTPEPVPVAAEPVPVAAEPVPVAAEPVPVAAEPVPAPIPVVVPQAAEQSVVHTNMNPDKYWDEVTVHLRNAKHAIASESYIRAAEIISGLRKTLIELVCVSNGITENFERAIDFIPSEDKRKLERTYPSKIDTPSLITALAVIEEMFEERS